MSAPASEPGLFDRGAACERARASRPRAQRSRAGGPAIAGRQLPDYAAEQEACHRAFRGELQRALADAMPLDARLALDVACGDGTYAAWLSGRLGPGAIVAALDSNVSWLCDVPRKGVDQAGARSIEPMAGDALQLPFADGSFDAVWCSHSLYALPDAARALAEMRRVTRPGGVVAVMESDTLHELVLPWPPELELALRRAELQAFRREAEHAERYYAGRSLLGVFHRTGFRDCSLRVYASARTGPAAAPLRTFLSRYLSRLQARAAPFLAAEERRTLDVLLDPGSAGCLLDRADFMLATLTFVVRGIR